MTEPSISRERDIKNQKSSDTASGKRYCYTKNMAFSKNIDF